MKVRVAPILLLRLTLHKSARRPLGRFGVMNKVALIFKHQAFCREDWDNWSKEEMEKLLRVIFRP